MKTTILSRVTVLSAIIALAACSNGSPGSTPAADTASPAPGGGGPTNGGNTNNTMPVAVNDNISNFRMNSPQNRLALLANDTDADNDNLSVTAVGASATGAIVRIAADAQSVIYTPAINSTDTDTFSYTISDGQGGSAQASVTVTPQALTAPPVGPRPCAEEQLQRIAEGRPFCFDVMIPSGFDDHTIAATVFVPVLQNGDARPVLLHAHGFGESRFASLENPNSFMINRVTAQSLLELWHEGYWVVSYDQRGFNANVLFGPSTPAANDPCAPPAQEHGCIDVMNPEREARDMTVVVDWIARNLREGIDPTNPQVSPPANATPLYDADSTDDPVLGTIGLSYGGGFQTIGSSVDKALNGQTRVNAMVPVTTWYDLRFALAPNDVPKSGWVQFLTVALNLGATPPLSPFIAQAGAEAFTPPNEISRPTFDGLYQRSPRAYCEGNGTDNINDVDLIPEAGTGTLAGPDVFVIVGQRDILFNFNEAYDLAQCYAAANPNADVRLLSQTEGHILPAAQPASYRGANEVIYIDETVFCGAQELSTRQMISGWFREKLGVVDPLAMPTDASNVPVVCINQFEPNAAPVSGIVLNSLDDVVIGGTEIIVDGVPATNTIEPITFASGPNPATIGNAQPIEQTTVFTATETTVLAGIPRLSVDIQADLVLPPVTIERPVFFIGLGVQRAGGGLEIIADQILPISGPAPVIPSSTSNYQYGRPDDGKGFDHGERLASNGDLAGRLIGVSSTLNVGDELQLLFFDQHPAYNTSGLKLAQYNITLSNGVVRLPLSPAPAP